MIAFLRPFLILVLATCVLTACERDRSDPPKELTIQLNWFPDGELAYWYYGVNMGYFSDAGFDIEINGGKGSSLSARLLVSKSADVAVMGPDAFLKAIQSGEDLVSLGIVYDSTPVSIYSLADRGITKLEDLYGRKLGVMAGSNTLIQYAGIADRFGLDRSRIEEIAVDPAVGPKLVEDGSLDAMVHYTHYPPLELRMRGIEVNEILFRDLGLDIIGMIVAVRRESISEFDVDAFASAVRTSIQEANKNRTQAFEALSAATDSLGNEAYEKAKMDIVLDLACLNKQDCPDALTQTADQWSSTIDSLIEFSVIQSEPDPASFMYDF